MKKIMVFIGSYLPGTKSAGVTTSIHNMVETLSDKYDFYIVTEDRDKGDTAPYTDVELDKWTKYESANVFYSTDYTKSLASLKRIIDSVDVDMYYLNSFYNSTDTARIMLLWALGRIKRKPFIIAPRGIFNMGEFKRREKLKTVYRAVYRLCGMDKHTYWHATAETEKAKILEYFPRSEDKVFVVGNLSGIELKPIVQREKKESGSLRIIFISRISEKKNIRFIVGTLMGIKGERIVCDIYGMMGNEADRKYWEQCEEAAKQLPNHIEFAYRGEISHNEVATVFREHHVFFFPTFGENYGHVIAESIANGCPVLLSDTTPWSVLPSLNAGWIYSLSRKDLFEAKLQELVDMGQEEWNAYSEGAYKAALQLIDNEKLKTAHEQMFEAVLNNANKGEA